MIAVDERMRRKSAEEYLASTAESERFLDYLTERNEQEAKTWIVKKWKKVCDFLRVVFKKYTGKELSSKDEMVLDALYRSAQLLGSDTYARFNYYRNLVREMGADGVAGEEIFKRSDNDAIFTAAKNKFGITYDMREAGYILPDGSMLDFSGRHELRGSDASFLNGRRTVDHRQIQDIAYDFDDNETGIETNIGDFLDKGAIRIDYNTGAINLNVSPTNAQKEKLRRFIVHNDGDVSVDFGKGFNTEHYVNYKSSKSSRVLGDIDRYFSEGIKPISDIMFRKGKSVEEVNSRFNDELQKQIDGTLPNGHIYQLGMPSDILRSCGFPDMPIELSSTNLAEHARKTYHTFELEDVKDIVNALQNPIAVFSYGDKYKSQNVIVEIQKDDRNFLVGVHFNQNRNGIDVSSIRGIFPKDNAEWLNWINQGKSLYLNKDKIQDLIDKQRKNLADVEYLDLDSVSNIVKDFENPSVESVNSSNEQEGAIMYRRGKPAEYVNLSNLFKPKGTLISSALAKEQALVGAYMQWIKGLLGAGRLVTNNQQSASVYAQAVKNYSSMKKSSLLRS